MINALKVADTPLVSITSAPLRVEPLVQQGSLNLSPIYRCLYLLSNSRISLFFHKFACLLYWSKVLHVDHVSLYHCLSYYIAPQPRMLRNVEHGQSFLILHDLHNSRVAMLELIVLLINPFLKALVASLAVSGIKLENPLSRGNLL